MWEIKSHLATLRGAFVGNDGALAPGKHWVGKANGRGKGQN